MSKIGQWLITPNDDRIKFEEQMATKHGCVYHDGRCLVHDETMDMTSAELNQYQSIEPPKRSDTVRWKHKNY